MDSQTVGLLTVTLKGTLHPFALSFPLLETQLYYWMVVQHSLIFPW